MRFFCSCSCSVCWCFCNSFARSVSWLFRIVSRMEESGDVRESVWFQKRSVFLANVISGI